MNYPKSKKVMMAKAAKGVRGNELAAEIVAETVMANQNNRKKK